MLRDIWNYLRALLNNLLAIMGGSVGLASVIADHFLSESRARWVFSVISLIAFAGAPFFLWRNDQQCIAKLRKKIDAEGRLEITFEGGTRRFEEIETHLYRTTRRLSVRITNIGGRRVENIFVFSDRLFPDEGNLQQHIRLNREARALNPSEFFDQPIASYQEPADSMAGATFGDFHIPQRADENGQQFRNLSKDTTYKVTLRATGTHLIEPCVQTFLVWIDEGDRLRMEAAS